MDSGFEIRRRRTRDGATVVAVTGDIDLFTTPEFKLAIAEAAADPGDTVVVDLTGTTFLDSSSLGVLIGARRQLERRGRSLIVACDREPILKVFRVTGLDDVFRMVDSVPEGAVPDGAVAPSG